MREIGQIVNVSIGSTGSELAADAAIAATTLFVENAYDFNEGGGTLDLNGALLTYTKADPETDTITMSAGIPTAAVISDPVLAYPYGAAKVAFVDLYDGEEGVQALVPFEYMDRIDDGIRDVLEREQVLIDDSTGRWVVIALDEEIPMINGGYIDPMTIPASVDPNPPANSPAVTITGFANGLVIHAGTIDPGTILEYHISTTSGFTPSAGTLSAETRSTVYVVTQLPDSTAFVANTPYYVRTIAKNTAGAAAAGVEAEGLLNLDAVEEFVSATIIAGFILAGRVQFGVGYIDANEGIVLPQPDGSFTRFPIDGVTTATISGFMVANGLTVKTNAALYGLTQLFGTFTLANGITDPTAAPDVTETWDKKQMYAWYDSTQLLKDPSHLNHGLADNSAGTDWVSFYSLWGGTNVNVTQKTTGSTIISSTTGSNLTSWTCTGGVTRLGTTYYALGLDTARGSWYVYKFDGTWAKTGEFVFGTNVPYTPAITNDGTNIFIAWCTSGGSLKVRSFNTSGTQLTDVVLQSSPSITANLSGVYVGSADFGAFRYVVQTRASYTYIYNSVFARQATEEWGRAGSQNMAGLHWDGTRFRTLDDVGRIWDYSTHVVIGDQYGRYTWYDGDTSSGSSTHETAASPYKYLRWNPRTKVVISTPPAPDEGVTDPALRDKANLINVYLGATNSTTRLQSNMALGVTSYQTETINGASALAPTTSNFGSAGAAPGLFQSSANDADGKLIIAKGDGSGRMGPWKWDSTCEGVDTIGARSITTAQAIADATWTVLGLTATPQHVGTGMSLTTSVVTVTSAGIYAISAGCSWAVPATAGRIIVAIESYTGTAPAAGAGTELNRNELTRTTTAGSIMRTDTYTQAYIAAGAKVRAIVYQALATPASLNVRNDLAVAQLNIHRVG